RFFPAIASREIDRISIRRNYDVVHLQIEVLRQLDTCSRSAVVSHQAPAIRFEARRRLRAIQDELAVARVDRTRIVAVVAHSDILCWTTCDGRDVDVTVR